MHKRVVIVHGWQADPSVNWFPTVASDLRGLGYEVFVPAMPNPDVPTEAEWTACLSATIGTPDTHTYLVGHSLGTIAILRYLESLPDSVSIGGVVLVAGFIDPIMPGIFDSFHRTPVDAMRIHPHLAHPIVLFASDDDPVIPFAQTEAIRDRLGAQVRLCPGKEHLNLGTGFFAMPEIAAVIEGWEQGLN